MNSAGDFLWARQFGGDNTDLGYSIDIDNSGFIYGTGGFRSNADFDPSPTDEFIISSAGNYDIFVNKLTNDGDFVWVKHMRGGIDGESGYKIIVDSHYKVYITGIIRDNIDFDPSDEEYILYAIDGGTNGFLQKLDSAGQLVWVEQLEGPTSAGNFILDHDHNIYLTGAFRDTVDFEFGGESQVLTTPESAGYVLKLNQGFLKLNEAQQNKKISLFPNPATNVLNVKVDGDMQFTIFNQQGQKLFSGTQNEIDISSFDKGVYLIQITDSNDGFICKDLFVKI
jgi:hypothetical protein